MPRRGCQVRLHVGCSVLTGRVRRNHLRVNYLHVWRTGWDSFPDSSPPSTIWARSEVFNPLKHSNLEPAAKQVECSEWLPHVFGAWCQRITERYSPGRANPPGRRSNGRRGDTPPWGCEARGTTRWQQSGDSANDHRHGRECPRPSGRASPRRAAAVRPPVPFVLSHIDFVTNSRRFVPVQVAFALPHTQFVLYLELHD